MLWPGRERRRQGLRTLSFLCCLLLVLAVPAQAWLTLGELRGLGATPLSREQGLAFFAQGKLQGQTVSAIHDLSFSPEGAVSGTFCFKRDTTCKRPGRGSGEWSIAPDGTLRFSVNWVSHISTTLSGKLYRHEGFVYLFGEAEEADGSAPWPYRFAE